MPSQTTEEVVHPHLPVDEILILEEASSRPVSFQDGQPC